MWTLTFTVNGEKQVEIIPEAWVSALSPLVEDARELRSGLAELLAVNAQLLRLWRQEQRAKKASKRGPASKATQKARRRQKAQGSVTTKRRG